MATGTQRFSGKRPSDKENAMKNKKMKSDKARTYSDRGNIVKQSTENKEDGKKSRCPYFKKCGACQMIDTPYDKQLRQKHAHVAELLEPYTRVAAFIGMEEPEHYRCKVHAVFTHDKKGNPVALHQLIL